MKHSSITVELPSNPAPAKRAPAKRKLADKPTPWGRDVLKKIEALRKALAAEK
jgi:hypothetical protein